MHAAGQTARGLRTITAGGVLLSQRPGTFPVKTRRGGGGGGKGRGYTATCLCANRKVCEDVSLMDLVGFCRCIDVKCLCTCLSHFIVGLVLAILLYVKCLRWGWEGTRSHFIVTLHFPTLNVHTNTSRTIKWLKI